jgi:hypothetical protein
VMENAAGFGGRESPFLESVPHRFHESINGGRRDGQERFLNALEDIV